MPHFSSRGAARSIAIPTIAGLAALAIFVARRPDVLTNAQFWAEDGAVWFRDAFERGFISSLLIPHTGYFQTFSRLVMGLATKLPLDWAPTFANCVALLFRALPIAFLFSRRFSWAGLSGRLIFAAFYLLMPNLNEVHANVTNTHWYLAAYLLMVIVADDPLTKVWKAHDLLVLALSGSSGPFVLFLAPAYATKLLSTRKFLLNLSRFELAFSFCLAALLSVQLTSILLSTARLDDPLQASPILLAQILASRIFAGFAFDSRFIRLFAIPYIACAIVFCAAIIMYVTWTRGDWRSKSVIVFLVSLIAGTLLSPTFPWPWFLTGSGERYFVVTSISWFAILCFFGASIQSKLARTYLTTLASLGVVLISIQNFRISPLTDLSFHEYARRFDQLPPGGTIAIPIQPPGWTLSLDKPLSTDHRN